MRLSKAEAKKIGIEVWDYLAKHGEIEFKRDLPKKLWHKIENMIADCPLCQYFGYETCIGCPLMKSKKDKGGCKYYNNWNLAKTNKTRAKYAAIIRDKIKEW